MSDNLPDDIKTIRLMLPYGLGTVNCYLIHTESGFILIDSGPYSARSELEKELEDAGCKPGDLRLIVITHGDFDHTGNAAFIGGKFGAKIAMHKDDAGMAERGDMFWNRKKVNALIRMLAPLLFRFKQSDRFTPGLFLEDGSDLSAYGFAAKVLSIPGHSKGSIGILTMSGGLFCGDLFTNTDTPVLNSIIDDPADANASIQKLFGLKIHMVYPGHGAPFPMDPLLINLW